jgi:hypothetical protein
MPFLPGLAVVFAGILGGGHGGVDRQVKAVVHDLHVKPVSVPAATLRTLTHHGEGTRDLVKKLHAEGVIGFEVVTGHGAPTLRLVVYDADGGLKTYTEISLGAHGLSPDDLDVLKSNLSDDVSSLAGAEPAPEPAPAPAPAPVPDKKPAVVAKAKAVPPPVNEIEMDEPVPPVAAPAVAKEQHEQHEQHEQDAPKQVADADSDAVSADEIAAMTSSNENAGGGEVSTSSSPSASSLHLGAAVGIGFASRYFTPSPSTVASYSSSPVASLQFEGHIQPTARTSLSVLAERTAGMTTPMGDGSIAATTISHWEAAATYAWIHRSSFELGPQIGIGRRTFAIDSADPARSPDGDYTYLKAGLAATAHVGARITLRAAAAFEPVVSGSEPTEMEFGEATRWGLDVGGAVEYRPFEHVFARVSAAYQRFTWSWDMAGARGAGGAVDEYPSGTLSLGADY